MSSHTNSPFDRRTNAIERSANECAYEVPDVRSLIEGAGFCVMHHLRRRSEHPQSVVAHARERYDSLDAWDKWRKPEVLADGGGSSAMWLTNA